MFVRSDIDYGRFLIKNKIYKAFEDEGCYIINYEYFYKKYFTIIKGNNKMEILYS